MSEYITPESAALVLGIISAIVTGIWRLVRWVTDYVTSTTAELRSDLTATQNDLQESRERHEASRKKHEDAEMRLDEARETIKGLELRLQAQNTKSEKLEQRVSDLERDLSKEKGRSEERETMIVRLNDDLRTAHEKNGELNGALVTANLDCGNRVSELEAKVSELENDAMKLMESVNNRNSVITKKTKEVDALKSELDAERQNVLNLKKKTTALDPPDVKLNEVAKPQTGDKPHSDKE